MLDLYPWLGWASWLVALFLAYTAVRRTRLSRANRSEGALAGDRAGRPAPALARLAAHSSAALGSSPGIALTLPSVIAEIMRSDLDRQVQQERIVLAVVEASGAEFGSLWLLSSDRGSFSAVAEINRSDKSITPVRGIRLATKADVFFGRMQSEDRLIRLQDLSEQERADTFFTGFGFSDLAMLPLVQRGDLIGFVLLGSLANRTLDPEGMQAVQQSSVLLSPIAENWRLRDSEREEGRRMQTLAELSAALTARRRLRDVLPEIVATGRDLARSLTCSLLLINEKKQVIELVAGAGLGQSELPRVTIPLDHPIVAAFIGAANSLIVVDIDRDMPNLRPLLIRPEVQSIQIYPLRISGKVIGALTIGHDQRRAPSETEQNLAETLASVAASAIQNARAFEAELEHVKLITTVSAISRRVSGILDTEWMLQEVCSLLSLELDYPFVHAFLVEDEEQSLRYVAGSSPSGPVILEDFQLSVRDESMVGLSARTGQPQMGVPSLTDRFHSQLAIKDVLSELVVPISAHNRVVGVLTIQSPDADHFDGEDLQLLNIVADQLSIALDNARHHAQVREQARLDSLTQVLNHGTFVNSLHELVRSARKTGEPLSLIMLDVDRFKEYNDHFGHVAGDAALKATVQAIEANIKARDVVGRWGGEEFGIVLLGATKDQAGMVAERIRKTLASLVPVDRLGREMPPPSVSQGIATLEIDADNADQLVDVADRALYAAKEHGRDQVRKAGQAP